MLQHTQVSLCLKGFGHVRLRRGVGDRVVQDDSGIGREPSACLWEGKVLHVHDQVDGSPVGSAHKASVPVVAIAEGE